MVQKRRSTDVRKKQIVEAARKLISKKGSEHLTVRSIAKEVDITEAAIYRHFRSKREILSFLIDHIMESMLAEIDKTSSAPPVSLDALGDVLKKHLSEIEQRRGMTFQVIAEIISLGDKKLNREVYEKLTAYIDRLKQLLDDCGGSDIMRQNMDHQASALLLFGMIQGLVNIWALSNFGFNLLDKFDSLWAIYTTALLAENQAASPPA
jgi:AcrR family transcriptional regulator